MGIWTRYDLKSLNQVTPDLARPKVMAAVWIRYTSLDEYMVPCVPREIHHLNVRGLDRCSEGGSWPHPFYVKSFLTTADHWGTGKTQKANDWLKIWCFLLWSADLGMFHGCWPDLFSLANCPQGSRPSGGVCPLAWFQRLPLLKASPNNETCGNANGQQKCTMKVHGTHCMRHETRVAPFCCAFMCGKK